MMHKSLDFSDSLDFSEYIETICRDTGNYIDTVIQYAADNYIDLEEIKPLIHPTLKARIHAEAIDRGIMKSLGTLDF